MEMRNNMSLEVSEYTIKRITKRTSDKFYSQNIQEILPLFIFAETTNHIKDIANLKYTQQDLGLLIEPICNEPVMV